MIRGCSSWLDESQLAITIIWGDTKQLAVRWERAERLGRESEPPRSPERAWAPQRQLYENLGTAPRRTNVPALLCTGLETVLLLRRAAVRASTGVELRSTHIVAAAAKVWVRSYQWLFGPLLYG